MWKLTVAGPPGTFGAMHIGEKIQAKAKEMRIGPTELARRIRTSKQNVYGIFHRQSIDTDLLMKLSKALDFDFFIYYNPTTPISSEAGSTYQRKKKGDEEVTKLKQELADLREKYELLKALYESKTGTKPPGS